MPVKVKTCQGDNCRVQLVKDPRKSYAEFAMRRYCKDCWPKLRAGIRFGNFKMSK